MGLKVSTIVDAKIWREFKRLAEDSHQNLSGLLTEALADFLQRKRVRPTFLKHMEASLQENEQLGRLLAK
ncbi:MAG: hypothetical protein HY696_04520 [Deltaproteobacteria bacterium]|nr:hypothetical protein [Deltaproteobacteria bacterium]